MVSFPVTVVQYQSQEGDVDIGVMVCVRVLGLEITSVDGHVPY